MTHEEMYKKVEPLWNKIKKRYPKECNVDGLEPAIISDIAEIALSLLTAEREALRGESIPECKHKWVKTDNTIGGWKIGDKQSCTKCGAVNIPVL